MSTNPADITIAMLGTSRRAEPLTPKEWKRVKARAAWVKETLDRWRAAQRHMDEVCTAAARRLFGDSPPLDGEGDHPQDGGGAEAEFNRLCDAEQAKVAAIRNAAMKAS